jgi:hypothetical protein
VKEIPLTRGMVAVVDDHWFDFLNQWKWMATNRVGKHYAARGENKKLILMHRVITNAPSGMQVDHINGNGLDNRMENLRVCTGQENIRNQALRKDNTTGYKGVTPHKKKYRAQIYVNGNKILIGVFSDPKDAARAYDEKAKELHGEFSRLNFPRR